MTAKDYKMVAGVLKDCKPDEDDAGTIGERIMMDGLFGLITERLCAAFERDNPKFNESLFRELAAGKDV